MTRTVAVAQLAPREEERVVIRAVIEAVATLLLLVRAAA
jgi:hypothetical protein